MSKPYALEVRESPREKYLKVFLRDDSDAEKVQQLLSRLNSVRISNITQSKSLSHPGKALTLYAKATHDIEDVKKRSRGFPWGILW